MSDNKFETTNSYKPYRSYLIRTDGQVFKDDVNVTGKLGFNSGYKILDDNEHLHKVMMKLFNYDEEKFNSRHYVINHIDLNPLNNSIDNLEYATYSENALNQRPKVYVETLPDDCFIIKTIRGNILRTPLIYSPSNQQYYRLYNNKYRIVNTVLTGNCHYLEIEDNKKKYRFVCDNIIGYKRPKIKTTKPKSHSSFYVTKSGERRRYDYTIDKKTESQHKLTTLLNYIERNKLLLNSIKTIKEKTDFINTEIPDYNYSVSMIYKYVC